jgi:hypothetical protein
MSALRLIVIAANVVFLAWLGYVIATAPGPSSHDSQFWLGWGILTCLALNLVHQAGPQKSRIFRLISLWFDAKETELRRRADQNQK